MHSRCLQSSVWYHSIGRRLIFNFLSSIWWYPCRCLRFNIDRCPHKRIWNRQVLQEMQNQHKYCVILRCLLESCRCSFLPIRFLSSKNKPDPPGNSLLWALSSPSFPLHKLTVQRGYCSMRHFAFLSCRATNLPYVPVSSTKLHTKASPLPNTSSYFLPSVGHFLDTHLVNLHILKTYQQKAKHAGTFNTCITLVLHTVQWVHRRKTP